jgi:hypothetical protein
VPLIVRCFPSDDDGFHRDVNSRLATLPAGNARTDLLEAIRTCLSDLRETYPRLRVRVADPLASTEDDQLIVYVYREGSAIPLPRDGPGARRAESPLAQRILEAADSVARSADLAGKSKASGVDAAAARSRRAAQRRAISGIG